MKSTPSGYLLVQEASSNSLIVLSSQGQEKVRYNAATRFDFRNAGFTQLPLMSEIHISQARKTKLCGSVDPVKYL